MVNEILGKVDFLELVSRRVSLSKAGVDQYRGLSPFTNEKSPSFFVNVASKTWYDFSAGMGGGVIDYVRHTESLGREEALSFLADMVGVELDTEHDAQVSAMRKILRTANDFFVSHADLAIPYMESRGFSEEFVRRYGIGFSPEGNRVLVDHLLSEGYSFSDMERVGLARTSTSSRKVYSFFHNRVMFPIKDAYGNIVSFTGRSIEDNPRAKYLHGATTRLFRKNEVIWNLSNVRKLIAEHNMVIVCEGQMDALAVCDAGLPGVAILGSKPSATQIKLLGGASSNIYFLFDADKAGEKALLEAFSLADETGVESVIYATVLPEGEDPHSLITTRGVDEFLKLIYGSTSDTTALLRSLMNKHLNPRLTRAEYTSRVIHELAGFVKNNLTYRSLDLIERAAQEFSVNQKELRTMIENKSQNVNALSPSKMEESTRFSAPVYERRILYTLLDEPHMIRQFDASGVSVWDFENELAGRVVALITPDKDSAEVFEHLRENLTEDEYYTILEFYSRGVTPGDMAVALDIMKMLVLKRTRESRGADFLGRPVKDTQHIRDRRRELKEKLS